MNLNGNKKNTHSFEVNNNDDNDDDVFIALCACVLHAHHIVICFNQFIIWRFGHKPNSLCDQIACYEKTLIKKQNKHFFLSSMTIAFWRYG